VKTIGSLLLIVLLTGCATNPEDVVAKDNLETRHVAWSAKTAGYADANTDVSVFMNRWGLLYLKVDGKIVVNKHNWCVEIREFVKQ
jgi:hypothetical protein